MLAAEEAKHRLSMQHGSHLPAPTGLVNNPTTSSQPMAMSLGSMSTQHMPAGRVPHPGHMPHGHHHPHAHYARAYGSHPSHHASHPSHAPSSPSVGTPRRASSPSAAPQGQGYHTGYMGYPMPSPHAAPVRPPFSGFSSVSENSSCVESTTASSMSQPFAVGQAGQYMHAYCDRCRKKMKKQIRRLQMIGISCLPSYPGWTELQVIDYHYKIHEPEYRAIAAIRRAQPSSEVTNSDSGYISQMTHASSDCPSRPMAPPPSE